MLFVGAEAEEQSGKGVRPSTLKGKSAPEMVRLLQAKGSKKGMGVRLSELHMVFMAVKTPGTAPLPLLFLPPLGCQWRHVSLCAVCCSVCAEDGEHLPAALSLYLSKNVEFRTETVSHFAKACNRAGTKTYHPLYF